MNENLLWTPVIRKRQIEVTIEDKVTDIKIKLNSANVLK